MSIRAFCPNCGQEMAFDLILEDGKGVVAQDIVKTPNEKIAGYGFFCKQCLHGWTGDELARMGRIEGYP